MTYKPFILIVGYILAVILAGCAPTRGGSIPGGAAPATAAVAASSVEAGQTVSVLPTHTSTATPTLTVTPTPTRIFTVTPQIIPTIAGRLNVFIRTCDTGFDVFNQFGEVTNAYVTLQNTRALDMQNVVVTLLANDEDKDHPDKQYLVQSLPQGYEISLKLTVDTRDDRDTAIRVTAKTTDVEEFAEKQSCKARRPDKDILNSMGDMFTLRKITTFKVSQ